MPVACASENFIDSGDGRVEKRPSCNNLEKTLLPSVCLPSELLLRILSFSRSTLLCFNWIVGLGLFRAENPVRSKGEISWLKLDEYACETVLP
jgi:hypothetical protein